MGKRILVADDNAHLLSAMCRILVDVGYAVICVNTTPDAILVASSTPAPDLVILDIVMPGNGKSVLDLLRSARSEMPVVIITGDDKHQGLKVLAESCCVLFKPFEPEKFLEAVTIALNEGEAVDTELS